MISSQNKPDVDKQYRRAEEVLQQYWGYDRFRPGQDEVVKSVFRGGPVVVLFPTGGGKSLCYQIPALVLDGLTLVISPLVALMEDQVEQLNRRGIRAAYINSTLPTREVEQRLVNARNGMYKLLYCAPERLETPFFQQEAGNLNIRLVAVDEAHCISEWGHDFRPSYRTIREALNPHVPSACWMALTATATPEVRNDIVDVLGFEKPAVISRGFSRPNLKWWVYSKNNRMDALRRMLSKEQGSGLIYAGTRKACEDLAATLQKITGRRASAYHAGLEAAERTQIQEKWIKGEIPVVVATNAFGMGIDKSDCRYVIHYDAPQSLEAYYQEAGRAGRDGEPASVLLFYRSGAFRLMEQQITDNYPGREELDNLYRGICDALQLALGSGMDEFRPLRLDSVEKRTGLSRRVIQSGLRIFARQELIEMHNPAQQELGVRFLASVDALRSLGRDVRIQEKKKLFIENIFRLFGPESLNQQVYLPAAYVAERTGFSATRVIGGLEVLRREQWLEFHMQAGEPLVRLTSPRETKPVLDARSVEIYRKLLIKKLGYMKQYAESRDCRSRFLSSYFGETGVKACGSCDNCRRVSPDKPSPAAVTDKTREILFALKKNGAQHVHQLSSATGIPAVDLRKQLKWMMREGIIKQERRGDGAYYSMR